MSKKKRRTKHEKDGGKMNKKRRRTKHYNNKLKLVQKLPGSTELRTHFSFQTSQPQSRIIFHCLAQNPPLYTGTMSPFFPR